ncbi:MAG: superoxide dismutase family protein [Pacificimonas sp.]
MQKIGFALASGTLLGLALTIAACQPADTSVTDNSAVAPAQLPPEAVAYAQLTAADGTRHGRAVFTDTAAGVEVEISFTGLPANVHAVHVHETGACTPPDYTSSGGHWNPAGVPHPQHKGDLGNVGPNSDGTASLSAVIEGVSLFGGNLPMLDADGAALIVHAMADDMVSQPSGAAGPRLACGVVTAG